MPPRVRKLIPRTPELLDSVGRIGVHEYRSPGVLAAALRREADRLEATVGR